MKTISFFSEKGGVGKSSFSILYASWLRHKYGVRVALADFNHRIQAYRNAEIRERKKLQNENPDAGIPDLDPQATWPIAEMQAIDIARLKDQGVKNPHAKWFREMIEKRGFADYDVVICDFPGALSGEEYFDMVATKQIGLVVVPVEKDEMTINASVKMHRFNSNPAINQKECFFLNKAQTNLHNIRLQYVKLAELLEGKGFPMLPDMISYSDKMTVIDKVDSTFRSTFNYPDFSDKKAFRSGDLGLENLFIDVTRLLKETPDLPDTVPSDLAFVGALEKKDDGRQILLGRLKSFPRFNL